MGAHTAGVSRSIYNEELRYAMGVVQEGISWVDADENDSRMGQFKHTQRLIQHVFGNGYPEGLPNAFLVAETAAPANNFRVTGGSGTAETAARYWVGGLACVLYSNADYVNAGASEAQKSIHPRSTSLAPTVLTDTAANYATNELAGRTLIPDITTPANSYVVASNTATTITIASGDMVADGVTAGDRYLVTLTTPAGAARTDGVYLNTYLDEIDSDEDPNLKHVIDGATVEAQRRLQVVQTVFVRQNTVSYGELTDYVDADANQHYVTKLATLVRPDGVADILTAHISDVRNALSLAAASKVKVSSNDLASGYLFAKLEQGTGVLLEERYDGGNERVRASVYGLPWQTPTVADDGSKKGRLACWGATGVPSTVAPVAAGYVLTDNGVDTPPTFRAVPTTDPQQYPAPIFVYSSSGVVKTPAHVSPYSDYVDVDIPLISIAAYRSHLVLAPNLLQTSRSEYNASSAPSALEGMCCLLGSANPADQVARVSLFIDGIQAYQSGGVWVAQVWGSTYASTQSGNAGFDVYSRGGSFNGNVPAPAEVLYRNFLHFITYSTDSYTGLYGVSTFYGYSSVTIHGHLYVAGDTLRMVLRMSVSSFSGGSQAIIRYRYETRTHGVAV